MDNIRLIKSELEDLGDPTSGGLIQAPPSLVVPDGRKG